MLIDREQNELIQPIIDIYNDMELELFKEIALRLSTYDGVSGSLQWYLDKINDMGILNDEAIKIIAKYSSLSEQAIREILEKAQYSIFDTNMLDEAFKRNVIPISPFDLMANKVFETTLIDSYKEAASTFKLIQTKALESTQQRYMDVLNKAYIETSTGTYSYSQSISKAMKEMAKKGITGATYKRKDGAIVNYSIEAAVRRDILTATNKTCNESEMRKIELLEAEYVEVSSHIGARVSDKNPIADHAGWQGKVYKLKGSEKDYPNFYEKTGYGDILGLGGVNCRHHFDAFFPGISTPAALKYDYEENKKYYEATQKQRKMERDIRYLKKQKIAFEQLGDTDEVQRVNRELRAKSKQLNEFCDKNNLRRDRSREKVVDTNIIIPKFGELEIKDSKYYKKYSNFEIDEILKSNEKILDDLSIPKSKWSGKVEFDDDESDIRKQFGKIWSCNIRTSHTTHPHILLHEQLHARSISYYDLDTYKKYQLSEELPVQFLTQEISKINKIEIIKGGFESEIDILREINNKVKLFDNDYDFALELFNQKVIDRYSWLESLIYDKMMITNNIAEMNEAMQLLDKVGMEW